jgi:cytochrome oxidase Cu insertion factor (SCO1/SenC/PrrC family)
MVITTKRLAAMILAFIFVLTACNAAPRAGGDAGQAAKATDAMMMDKPAEEMAAEGGETVNGGDVMMEKTPEAIPAEASSAAMSAEHSSGDMAMVEMPAFLGLALTDAASGQSFSLADFKGKVVLVETMAMWCPRCLSQQKEVQQLHDLLGERDDFVSVGLDVDPNENVGDLQGYVASNGFDWWYSVAPVEAAREISRLYGEQYLNPSSTPMFIIDRKGQVHTLPFGIKSAQDLLKALEPFLSESM